MGFWSTLGKIGGIAAAGVGTVASLGAASPALAAALGGAGALGKIGGIAKSVAPVLGGLAKGRAEGRVADTNAQQTQDRLGLDRARMMNQALQDEFQNKVGLAGTEAQLLDTRATQARRGDLLANVQDVHIPDNGRVAVQHWSGGVRPSALGPNARAAGARLSDTALAKMGHEGLPSAPGMSGNIPGVTPLQGGGFMDKLIGAAGAATSLGGAILPHLPKPKLPGDTWDLDPRNWET